MDPAENPNHYSERIRQKGDYDKNYTITRIYHVSRKYCTMFLLLLPFQHHFRLKWMERRSKIGQLCSQNLFEMAMPHLEKIVVFKYSQNLREINPCKF
jgi:hypothetical protein